MYVFSLSRQNIVDSMKKHFLMPFAPLRKFILSKKEQQCRLSAENVNLRTI